ncbi:MAG: sigma-54 dependent transcriptional regulator [Myxococcota bacterium]
MRRSVLIADDEPLVCRSLRMALEGEGYAVSVAHDAEAAMKLLQEDAPDCALIDVKLGASDGLELLRAARQVSPTLKAIIITAHGDVDVAVRALRLDAHDLIKKPFDLEEVLKSVATALRTEELELRLAYLDRRRAKSEDVELIGHSEPMRRLIEQVSKVAGQPVPVVLIRGETGTGKQLVAQALHRSSDRARGPFIELNCSALPEHLVESELFGHERGAFSEAKEQKHGLVELADGGTLFLDEIGDLPAAAQAKLLRFVENQEFRRLGGTKLLKVDCRIVTATHRSLEDSEHFRRDLYYRLSGVSLLVPPLRERGGDDVLALAQHFLDSYAAAYRKPGLRFTPAASEMLLAYAWPGNVRELKAAISCAAVMAEGTQIDVDALAPISRALDLDQQAATPHEGVRPLREIELEYCRQVLKQCGGNKVLAAEKLQISRHTLARKVGDS